MRVSLPIKESGLPRIVSPYSLPLFALAFCLCSFFLTYFTYQSLKQSEHESEHRYQTSLLVTHLHRSSDQLTIMARNFAETGNVTFLQSYQALLNQGVEKKLQRHHSHSIYWDILMSLSAHHSDVEEENKSFKQLIEELFLPENEVALLLQAQSTFEQLTKFERQAFSVIEQDRSGIDYAIGYANSEARKSAISILYSDSYLSEKDKINRLMDDFFNLHDPRSLNAIESNTYKHYLLATLTTLSFLVLISFLFYSLYKQSKSKQEFVKALRKEVSNRTLELFEKREQLKVVIHEMEDTKHKLVEAEKMASLGNLVSGVAHEVNTPLGISVTLGSHLQEEANLLLNNVQSGKLKRSDLDRYCTESIESCGLLLSNLDRAASLISSFKQVAVDQSSDEMRLFKVSEYADEVLLSLRPIIKKTDIKIVIETCKDEPLLNTYPGAIAQIVTNLVMNAVIHAFDNGTQAGNVNFKLSIEKENMLMQVCDDGKGMSKQVVNKIFEPFYTTQRGSGGSGLGMSIVYNLVVHQLQGSIECKSTLGEGTLFVIRFPMQIENRNK